jgi:uncharacterized protein CbrC (UPF0167 family)
MTKKNDPHLDPAAAGMPFPLFRAPLRDVSTLLRDVGCSVCGVRQAYAFPLADHDAVIRPCLRCARPVGLRRGWYRKPPEPTVGPHCGFANPWPADRADPVPPDPADPYDIGKLVPVCYACLRAGRVAISHETESFIVDYPRAVRGLASLRDPAFAATQNLPTTVLTTYDDGSQSLAIPLPHSLLFELLRTPHHSALQSEYWPWHCGTVMAYVGRWEQDDFNRHAGGDGGYAWFARHLPPSRFVEAEDMWDWLENGIAWTCVYQCQTCGLHRVYVDAD